MSRFDKHKFYSASFLAPPPPLVFLSLFLPSKFRLFVAHPNPRSFRWSVVGQRIVFQKQVTLMEYIEINPWKLPAWFIVLEWQYHCDHWRNALHIYRMSIFEKGGGVAKVEGWRVGKGGIGSWYVIAHNCSALLDLPWLLLSREIKHSECPLLHVAARM